ncbi:hypothetical protein [Chitinophaga sp.]|uniref:hypothetical protein n=1 Tax=Chitinophaga sp. TaxID=1869181 RepID=UPI002F928DEF
MPLPTHDSPDDLSQEELEQNLQSSRYPSTSNVPGSSLEQLFKIPENQQYTYATFSETFERYKVKIDLFKWLIGTVGLTVITYIINWGFRDREQGIAELESYNKYASESVVYAENPRNRLLLAEFFANVTPSKKLRDCWKDYLKVVKVQADSFDARLKRSQELVAVLARDTAKSTQTKLEYLEAKSAKEELERIDNIKLAEDITPPAIGFQKVSAANRNEGLARSYEMTGFKSLLSKDLGSAINNFKMSENSYNGYHMAYDIARYLQTVKTGASEDDINWKDIYQELLRKYSWKMPADIKKELSAAEK